MRHERSGRYLLVVGLMLAVGAAAAAPRASDIGKREYDGQCANCHGIDGKGGGPYAEMLKRTTPDLTRLSQKNGAVFPITRVYNVIEGAGVGHGSREMPIWGERYSAEVARSEVEAPLDERLYVRARILWLVEYLYHLQVK